MNNKENHKLKYFSELDVINRTCLTPDAFCNALEMIEKKYHSREEILKTLPNGIRKVVIFDKYDNKIAERYK